MNRPEYVRGAWFSSHAHYWEFKRSRAYIGGDPAWAGCGLYSATVWYKRRKVKND